MRVAIYYNNRDLRLEEVPVPRIGPGEILLRTMARGICGSDVLEWYRIKKAPLVLGHEIAGPVVETGAPRLRGHHACCENLRRTNFDPGGFAPVSNPGDSLKVIIEPQK